VTVRARLALSPTAPLTIAQARLALATHALAPANTTLLLLDRPTDRPDATGKLHQDLVWLGIACATEHRQSTRAGTYAAPIERLQQSRRLYPCFENPDELRVKQDRAIQAGRKPKYDRAMLNLTPAQRATAESKGKRPHWRFLLTDNSESDPILIATDGTLHPTLTIALDDIALGTTHLVRSTDEAGTSAIQQDIRAALGAKPLAISHIPPLTRKGARARDIGKITIRQLRQDGIEPAALAATLTEDAEWDTDALLRRNRAILATLDFPTVAPRLPKGATEEFWLRIRGDIDLLSEARERWEDAAGASPPHPAE